MVDLVVVQFVVPQQGLVELEAQIIPMLWIQIIPKYKDILLERVRQIINLLMLAVVAVEQDVWVVLIIQLHH